jgi:TorA maturation chaperone TorD
MREGGLERAPGQQAAASGRDENGSASEQRVIAPESGRGVSSGLCPGPQIDEIDLLRSHEYDLLATLLGRAPSSDLLGRLVELRGGQSMLGSAHGALARAAAAADPDALQREFFDLFIGLGRGELLPYASYYLTGFLNERPLARVREDLRALGIERAPDQCEPEDHIAILLEVMAGLASGRFAADRGAERRIFERHLQPWAERFFADLEAAMPARFYRAVGAFGRLFMEIEAEAFAIDAPAGAASSAAAQETRSGPARLARRE